MIQFNCPGCSKSYEVPDEVAGKFAKCRQCGRQIQIPVVLNETLELLDGPQPGRGPQPSGAPVFPPPPANQSAPNKPKKLVYPSSPPKDPILMALLSGCCVAWLGQIIMGQTAKGLVMLAVCVTLAIAGGIGIIVGWPLSAVDAYLTAKKLREGQPVGEWEFFGSWNPFE